MGGTGHRLEIKLLGGFSVAKDGVTLNIGSRAAQALLAYLALTAGSRHRRERLTALLWPDASDESARQNLRNALWALRKAVGEGYLLADKISVGFDPHADYVLDAATLSDGVDLEAAVAAYDGELLPGFYEEWVLLDRERLRAEFDRQAALLVDELLADGRLHDAQSWAERWIAQGQAPEPAYRALMSAHHALGDRAGMAGAYRRAVKALEYELGVEPSPETQALYERLQREPPPVRQAPTVSHPEPGRSDVRPGSATYASGDRLTPPQASTLPSFLTGGEDRGPKRGQVVGREPELARLASALESALGGRYLTLFVTGEAGRGKSSLLSEFADRAQALHEELVVAVGHCDAFTGGGDPLLPFRDALEMLAGDVEARWSAGTIDRQRAERLWRLLPLSVEAITHHGPELVGGVLRLGPLLARAARSDPSGRLEELLRRAAQEQSPSGNNQAALFEAYTCVLAAISVKAPVVLLLEDLHWADASSLALLFHLARRLEGSRVLIVGSLRAEELADENSEAGRSLERLIAELSRVQGPSRLDLDTGAAGREFIDQLLDTEPNRLGPDFRARLTATTEGHPLFAVELLTEMKAEGGLVKDDAGAWIAASDLNWHALPARVEGVIRTRFERLDSDLREALQVGSVEGATFSVEVVAKVLNVDARQLVRRLSGEAEKLHQLVEGVELTRVPGGRLARFRFRHDLFQRFLYNGLSGLDRAMLHEEVGAALEELHGDEAGRLAVELARHFEEGGLGERAADYLVQAGRQAARLYAYEEAATQLRRALELLGESESPAVDRLRLDALMLLGSALQGVHGYSLADIASTFERARHVAKRLGAAREEFSAAWSMSLYHSQRAEYERAVELGEELLRLGEQEGDDRLVLQAHHAIWFARFCLGDLRSVIEHSRHGVDLYPRGGGEDPSLRTGGHDAGVCAHLFAARALWHLGCPDDARVESDRGLEIAAGLTRPDSIAHAFAHAAEVSVLLGESDRALELAAKCEAVAGAAGLGFWAAWAKIMRGCASVQAGDAGTGIQLMRRGRSEYAGIGVAEDLNVWYRLAEAHMTLGEIAEAEECLAKAAAIAERLTAEVWRAELYRIRGVIDARQRGLSDAEESFAVALDIAARHGARALELRTATSWYEAVLATGASAAARRAAHARLAAIHGAFGQGHDTLDVRRAGLLLGIPTS